MTLLQRVAPQIDAFYNPSFLPPDMADAIFADLRDTLAWQQQPITIFGRTMMQPRLLAWYGDADAVYTYSGIRQTPLPWVPVLQHVKETIERAVDARFNSVLANYYRDGQDSMGWHSDDEPELGPEPVIASLSLGAARDFRFRRKRGTPLDTHTLCLQHGSLLLMRGNCQRDWQHAVPKRAGVNDGRINLTFRLIRA